MRKLKKQLISSNKPVLRWGYVDIANGEVGGVSIENINDIPPEAKATLSSQQFVTFYEVLDHRQSSINLQRVENGVCKLLDGHPSWCEGSRVVGKVVGSLSNCETDGINLYGDVEVLEGDETSKAIIGALDEGLRVPTSIGYRNNKGRIDFNSDKLTIRITDWELTHLAVVPEGADNSTSIADTGKRGYNVGQPIRSGELYDTNTKQPTKIIMTQENNNIPNGEVADNSNQPANSGGFNNVPFRQGNGESWQQAPNQHGQQYQQRQLNNPVNADGVNDIQLRNKLIAEYVEQPFNKEYVKNHRPVEEAVRSAMAKDNSVSFQQAINDINTTIAGIQLKQDKGDGAYSGFAQELDNKERKEYSYHRVLQVAAGYIQPDDAGLEVEFSNYIRDKNGVSEQGIYTSMSLLRTPITLETAASVGNWIQTTVLADQFTLPHRRMPLLEKLGAFALRGLRTKASIPVQTGEATSYWQDENPSSDVTESNITAAKRDLTPHRLSTTQAITYELLATEGSLEMDMIMRSSAFYSMMDKRDGDAINGNGSNNVPTGLRSTTGIPTLTAETNGSDVSWTRTIALWQKLCDANVSGTNWVILTSPGIWAKYLATTKDANTNQPFLSTAFPDANGVGMVGGLKGIVSTHIPANITRGTATTCSPAIIGSWADLVYAEWDSVQIISDPYTRSKRGLIELTLHSLHDYAVKRPASFAIDQFLKT